MTHCIDHSTLRKAALQIREIDEAGWGHRLDQAVNSELWTDENRYQLNALRFELQLSLSEVNTFADRLVALLECDREQALAVAIDVLDYPTKRAIVLKTLPRMVNELRQREAMARRNLRLGRAS